MGSTSCIEQIGVVDEITNGIAKVTITKSSACNDCQSKAACSIAGSPFREIIIPVDQENIETGDNVCIQMDQNIGTKALVLAYFVPFLLLITALIIFASLRLKELYAGLLSIAILVPYFVGLYIFRRKIKRTFVFTLRKTSPDD